MARTVKTGFDYFPLDTNFFSEDKRIKRLLVRYGADAPLLYLYVLCQVHGRAGYYVKVDNEWLEDAALELRMSVNKIGLMLNYMVSTSLLNCTSFANVKVLSSRRIQTQFQRMAKRLNCEIEVDERLWLLEKDETESFIKVRSNGKKSPNSANPGICAKEREKEKENERERENEKERSKEKDKEIERVKEREREREFRGLSDAHAREKFIRPSREEVIEYCKSRNSSVDPNRFYDFFSEGDWVDSKGNKVKNWKQKLITWESNSGVITKSQSRQPNWDMNYEEACQRDDRDLLEKLLGVAKEESNE